MTPLEKHKSRKENQQVSKKTRISANLDPAIE